MNSLVKILTDEDGCDIDNPKWCLSIVETAGNLSFCSGQFYGYGESSVEYKVKTTQKGGITCKRCLTKIKEIKAIKL